MTSPLSLRVYDYPAVFPTSHDHSQRACKLDYAIIKLKSLLLDILCPQRGPHFSAHCFLPCSICHSLRSRVQLILRGDLPTLFFRSHSVWGLSSADFYFRLRFHILGLSDTVQFCCGVTYCFFYHLVMGCRVPFCHFGWIAAWRGVQRFTACPDSIWKSVKHPKLP